MAASKFTEIFNVPAEEHFSERNVSLDDILEETRRRSSSASSSESGRSPKDVSSPDVTSPSSSTMQKLRRFTSGAKAYR